VNIVMAEDKDFASWLHLAEEVEGLFGPMVSDKSFKEALRRVITDKQAFCIRVNNGKAGSKLIGGIIISFEENEIMWFSVASQYRNQGVGQKLIAHAMNHLDKARPVTVSTFDKTVTEGIPARKLYLKNGFTDMESRGVNPAGIPIVLMIKKPV